MVYELLIPGLLGPLPLPPDPRIETPVLDLLLTRGERMRSSGIDLSSALLLRFGVDATAPYCLAAESAGWDRTGYWMHADPVHLRPDRDLLRLFDARHLGIDSAEAQVLVAELNEHFAADGLRFVAPSASRWYLRCARPPKLQTQPLTRAIGQHVDGLLPSGPDAARWASLMNEVQMLLFQSAVNRRREADGRPTVNGLWTWGGGVWQQPCTEGLPNRVFATHPLALGLARSAGIPSESPSQAIHSRAQIRPQHALVVLDPLLGAVLDQNEGEWVKAAERLDASLSPALSTLRAGHIDLLVIDSCAGDQWRIVRGHQLRFWRRPRTIASRMLPPLA